MPDVRGEYSVLFHTHKSLGLPQFLHWNLRHSSAGSTRFSVPVAGAPGSSVPSKDP